MYKKVIYLFSIFLAACGVKGLMNTAESPMPSVLKPFLNPALKPFYFGVASGDPDSQSVILWTRVTPDGSSKKIEVSWRICAEEAMLTALDSGVVITSAERDYTVKIHAQRLSPATTYYYQFSYRGITSVVGRTKTAPKQLTSQLKFAVVSCNNFEAGYFNGFARIAEQDDLDAVIHLGDYIYEYEPGKYGDKNLSRRHLPPKEIVSIHDYRTRYAQYRLDADLQRLHQLYPFITIWDDHEIANNAHATGAANHQPEEGSYTQRSQAARQAYYEWLPVKESPSKKLYRTICYGPLAQWILLDERLEARAAQLSAGRDSLSGLDTSRTMLGDQQRTWLEAQLTAPTSVWSLIGNQVIFSPVIQRQAGRSANMDAWDGYAAERKMIVNHIYEHQTKNVVFVSGDTHSSWAFEVPRSLDDYRQNGRSIGVELGTPSITSANTNERLSQDSTFWVEARLSDPAFNPHLKYVNLRDHGYLLLTIRATELLAEWRYLTTIAEPSIQEYTGHRSRIIQGTSRLIQ